MGRNKNFSQIRTYDELQAALQQVRFETDMNPLVNGVSNFMAGQPTGNVWADLALIALRAIRTRLTG